MAAERKQGRRGKEAAPEVPVVEPIEAHGEAGHGKDRGHKKAPGGFPGALPIAAGGAAAVLAFVGVMVIGQQLGPKDPYESLDAGGVHAARLLAAVDVDKWKVAATMAAIRAPVIKQINERKKEASGADDYPQMEEAIGRWLAGDSSPGSQWRPGFDVFFPRGDSNDAAITAAQADAIKMTETIEPGAFIGAMILAPDNSAFVMHPSNIPAAPTSSAPVKKVGETRIFETTALGRAARWYQHPAHNKRGDAEGSVVVILATSSVQPFPLAAAAGAAAALALLGGFLTATILAGGTKSALTQLASDAEALAKGNFDVKVAIAGPAVVQHVAKAVQKLAATAQSGAAAPPQVMVQEIVRAPVQEINEALAPSKGFQRPEELEVEATQKVSAELGNDYYDVVNVDDDHIGVFVADIPVRGVKSAMHMAAVRTLLRANAKGRTSPAETLKAVNRGFAVDLPRGVYVTAMYAVVHRTTGVCKVASAQHLPLVFWKLAKKASARLHPEGIALGLDSGAVFDKTITEKAIALEKGDRIVLFTDGAINAKNPAGAQYGEERFYYVVNREAPKNSAACVNFVANDVDLFHEGAPLTDDFTLVTVRKVR